MKDIYDWDKNIVTWGEERFDVSNEACAEQPILMVLRSQARRFDSAREDAHRYAKHVERAAEEIAKALDNNYMPSPLFHQRPADLNEAISKVRVISETMHALVYALSAEQAEVN